MSKSEDKKTLPSYLPLGYLGFATATALVAFLHLGKSQTLDTKFLIIAFAILFGGGAQIAVAFKAMKHNDMFAATALGSFGFYWTCYGIYKLLGVIYPQGLLVDRAHFGILLLIYAVYTILYTYIALTQSKVSGLVFAAVLFTLIFLGASELTVSSNKEVAFILEIIGGVFAMLAAIGAFYKAAVLLLKNAFGKDMLPMGSPFINKK